MTPSKKYIYFARKQGVYTIRDMDDTEMKNKNALLLFLLPKLTTISCVSYSLAAGPRDVFFHGEI